MWHEVLGKNKVKYTERYKDPMTGKRKYVSVTLSDEKRATQRLATATLEKKIKEKTDVNRKPDVTVGYVTDIYLKAHKKKVTLGTYTRDKGTLDKVTELLDRDSFVNRLTTRYIVSKFEDSGKKGITLNGYRQRFLTMLRWAYENDHIERIEVMDKFPKFAEETTKKERIQDKFLEDFELAKLIDAMKHEEWRLVTRFLSLSGLRIGEFIALDKSDVDLDNLEIRITKTFNANRGGIKDHPKTDCSIREVYIQDELLEAVTEINKYVNEKKMILGFPKCKIFFPGDAGGYMHYDAYRKYLKENSALVLGKQITPHALRHTHTSLMTAAGVQLEAITRRLGHADSDITKEIYLHVTKRLKERENNQIKNVRIIS